MIDQFRRRPNGRDREALERELAGEKRQRREEIQTSSFGLAVLAALSILLTVVLRVDDLWFPHRPTLWASLAESAVFFAVVATIGIVFGLPSRVGRRRTYFFDRLILRMTREAIDTLEAALNGEVHVLRCDATDVVGFCDDGDDIDWYAFQVARDRIFVVGDEVAGMVADESEFPNTSFEVVASAAHEDDVLAVHCLGRRLRLRRLLPTSARPQGVDVELPGRLEDLVTAAG